MNNVMLDLETLGTSSSSVIVQIGAAKFNASRVTDSFSCFVDLQNCVDIGMVLDVTTIKWWIKQSGPVFSIFDYYGILVKDALKDFSKWVDDDSIVWGNGLDFDNVILSNAYKLVGLETPWKYYNNRCYRTVSAMFPHIQINRQGTKHNALHDAEYQAHHLIRINKNTELNFL